MDNHDVKYDVVFFGLRSDTPTARDAFIQKLANTHGMPLEKFMFLKDRINVVLYSNLPVNVAEKTASWLEMIGAIIRIEPHRDEVKRKLAFRKCPNCGGFNKVESVRCTMCNFDFRQSPQPPQSPPVAIQKKPSTGSIPALSSNQFIRSYDKTTSQGNSESGEANPAGIDLGIFSSEPQMEEPKEPTMPIDLKDGNINPYNVPKTYDPATSSAPEHKTKK
jgi:hypothetical protein